MSGNTSAKPGVSWQQTANVDDTVAKAPRCLNVDSWTNVKEPIPLKTSRGGYSDVVVSQSLSPLVIIRMRLLVNSLAIAAVEVWAGIVP